MVRPTAIGSRGASAIAAWIRATESGSSHTSGFSSSTCEVRAAATARLQPAAKPGFDESGRYAYRPSSRQPAMTFSQPSSGQLSAKMNRTGSPSALRTQVGSVSPRICIDR
ncbi:hypothetical protein Prum_059150 [Phytohabitans rumicis]|uniref:Uncharacterized protein n=1 Tax=Phytohabitans rumicis TaxID=1076125 RepID=A0A6V8L4S4_9ACTN|nr:hypothetical protein Prum_059150 [Phytohabitans rumicis]